MFEETTTPITNWIRIDNMYIDTMSYSAFRINEDKDMFDLISYSIIGYSKTNISYQQTLKTNFESEEDAQKFLDELFNPEEN